MFYLDGTYRVDQSSTLPKGNWTYGYPSISGSFLFSELVKASWLDLGKLRLNYAEVGNDAPFASVLDTYVPGAPFSGNPLVSVASTKNNPDLKPERTKSIEAGIEMGMFKNRLGFDFAVRGRYIAVIRTVASPQPSSRCSGPRSCFSVLEPSSTTPWLQA